MDSISGDKRDPSIDEINELYVPEYKSASGSITEKLLATSFLLGIDHADSSIKLDDESYPLPLKQISFDEAASFLKNRIPVTKKEWNDIEEKLRFRAFTMTRLAELDYIEKAKQTIISSIESGGSIAESWKSLRENIDVDVDKVNPGYWETVYRTNIQTAYNAGRKKGYEKNPPDALALIVIEDGRTSSICRPLIGLVLPYNDPFWDTHWPPFHFNCRTTVRAVYNREIKDENVSFSNAPTSEVFVPQKGFGSNPLESGNWWMLRSNQIQRGLDYGIITEFNRSENIIADYDEIWKDYSRVEGKDGGWYDVVSTPPGDWEQNEKAVSFLSGKGYKIKVLPGLNRKNWKNPDVYINGILSDIKAPTAATSNAIKNAMKSAQDQNLSSVIISLKKSFPTDELARGFKGRFNLIANSINKVFLIYGNDAFEVTKENLNVFLDSL